jgi:hypothetical protein
MMESLFTESQFGILKEKNLYNSEQRKFPQHSQTTTDFSELEYILHCHLSSEHDELDAIRRWFAGLVSIIGSIMT